MYQLIQYIKFLIKSTNQHGVHSPFVFDLVTRCFYDKKEYPSYGSLARYKASLLRTDAYIKVHDLGPGSKKMKQPERHVSKIVKTSGTPVKRAKLLFRLSQYFNPNHILELGTSLGISTHAMAMGQPNAKITTVEGCPNLHGFSKDFLKRELSNEVKFINEDFNNAVESLATKKFDLIFFDGNHQKEATLRYFETLLPTAHNDSVFIFDDIYWSRGMTEAWEIIKQHPKVTVTIDTFYWGFVFFRTEQAKEHFRIRL
ncbi:class I SAM-dependent methyltransferase [Hyunsoonleella sp. SJ7]|uniref:Class I SAM-dependent methyltransferase n=2 Tax=Hyunsoonleella aquatilis TaxID=2762758 RepID=A0A923HB10_9FLAO|nr:class I SAM-dependent methyltransferase [Hyunsoonleella aquatilis]MBC3757736.1 class I SAM-dependent methyltransferase [Hyunsoonleella aquatilis]